MGVIQTKAVGTKASGATMVLDANVTAGNSILLWLDLATGQHVTGVSTDFGGTAAIVGPASIPSAQGLEAWEIVTCTGGGKTITVTTSSGVWIGLAYEMTENTFTAGDDESGTSTSPALTIDPLAAGTTVFAAVTSTPVVTAGLGPDWVEENVAPWNRASGRSVGYLDASTTPVPFAGIAAGSALLLEDFNGTSLDPATWANPGWAGSALNGIGPEHLLAANATVAGGICTLKLSDATHGAAISTNPTLAATGFSYGYGIVEWYAKLPANNWWALWQTWYTGPAPEFDVVESGGNLPAANYHFWSGGASLLDVNGTPQAASWLGGWHYFTLRRNADDTFDVWFDQTKIASHAGYSGDTGQDNFLIANIGVGNANTTVAGQTVQIDHVYVWDLP